MISYVYKTANGHDVHFLGHRGCPCQTVFQFLTCMTKCFMSRLVFPVKHAILWQAVVCINWTKWPFAEWELWYYLDFVLKNAVSLLKNWKIFIFSTIFSIFISKAHKVNFKDAIYKGESQLSNGSKNNVFHSNTETVKLQENNVTTTCTGKAISRICVRWGGGTRKIENASKMCSDALAFLLRFHESGKNYIFSIYSVTPLCIFSR